MKNIAYKIIGNVNVAVHGESSPSDAEWKEYTEAVRVELEKGLDPAAMRTLVFSDGGGPSAAQRKRINDILNGRTTPVALVSSSGMMRGVVTALQWFNPEMRTFSPDEVVDALKFLKVPESQYELIWKETQKLVLTLGKGGLKSVKAGQKVPPGM
jgi:hypothetical protein